MKKRAIVTKADIDLATKIATELFTNGSQERAQRLVLTIDTPVSRDLGGRSFSFVVDIIADALATAKQQ